MLKGNKGEWSEIYTLIKLLADGKLYAADENLEKIEDVFYPVIKIIREETSKKRYYIINGKVKVVDGNTNNIIIEIPTALFVKQSVTFFSDIKGSSGRTFQLTNHEDFLRKIDINSLKAKSTDKSDINIVVHDLNTGKKPTFGFSIKSLIGKSSTLFNPGVGTNFIYRISIPSSSAFNVNDFNRNTFFEASANNTSKISYRLKKLEELGCKITFDHIQSETLQLNLSLIDSNLPLIFSYMLYYKYRDGISKLKDSIKKIREENPLKYNLSQGHPFYEYKIKNLLSDYALGMTPEKVWTGIYDATGGIIIVKDSGDILCYHIYNKNEFQNYLINNTKLEQASTGEDRSNPGRSSTSKKTKPYKFGWVFQKDGNYYIKLNLQIRFSK